MKIGLSTGCLFPEKTDVAFYKIAKMGIKYVEIFFNTESELEESYLYRLKEIANKFDITVTSIHPYTSAIETFCFFSFYDYKLEDSIKMYEKYFKACQILNCKYVVFHGAFSGEGGVDIQRYCENLNKLIKKAREYDVYISQENVYKYKCGYIKNLKEFKKYIDKDIRYTFDIKQAKKAKQSIYKILDLMGDKISHVHISDIKGETHSLLPLEGNFNFKRFFAYLKKISNAEYALIEIYSADADNQNNFLQTIEKLDKLK